MTRTTHIAVVFALVLALVAAPLAPVTGSAARGPEATAPATVSAGHPPDRPAAETGSGPASVRIHALNVPAPTSRSPVSAPTTARRPTDADNATARNLTVGESLSGAIAAHDAELEGEVDSRAFSYRLTLATFRSNGSRAGVVADELARTRVELAVLTEQRQALRNARRNGTISKARYRVRMARLTVQARALERTLARADTEARELSDRTLAGRGVNRTDIAVLYLRADALSDREATALLEDIAGAGAFGPDATASPFDPASLAGPEADLADGDPVALPDGFDAELDGEIDLAAGTGYDTDLTLDGSSYDTNLTLDGSSYDTNLTLDGSTYLTDRTLEDPNRTAGLTERRRALLGVERNRSSLGEHRRLLVDRADGDAEAERALACAREALDDADTAIADARDALDERDGAAVDEALERARNALRRARDCLDDARRALSDDGDDSDGSDGTSTEDNGSTPTPTRDGSWSTK